MHDFWLGERQRVKIAYVIFYNLGHLVDPDDVPGIAHFCEHMLFLGTEKVKLYYLLPLLYKKICH